MNAYNILKWKTFKSSNKSRINSRINFRIRTYSVNSLEVNSRGCVSKNVKNLNTIPEQTRQNKFIKTVKLKPYS